LSDTEKGAQEFNCQIQI